jgi:FtsP/CotA-like multicopper oxidase with cupredoxin domain
MLTDSAGRVRVYLNAGETYEVTIETPRGDLTQFVHVARADGETVTQTVEVEKIVHVPDPEQAARIAELEARLAEAQARPAFQPHAEPEPVEMPDFLKAPEAPPAELADLFDPADTVPESNEKLLVRLREVLGLIGLAEDAGGRAAPELYRRKDRLESGIRWNRGRSAEVI